MFLPGKKGERLISTLIRLLNDFPRVLIKQNHKSWNMFVSICID